jgi:hypothetical protein
MLKVNCRFLTVHVTGSSFPEGLGIRVVVLLVSWFDVALLTAELPALGMPKVSQLKVKSALFSPVL